MAELSNLTYRRGGLGFDDAARYSVSPLSFWTIFVPDLFGEARDDSFRLSGLYWEQYGYSGLLPALLAIVARARSAETSSAMEASPSTRMSIVAPLSRSSSSS